MQIITEYPVTQEDQKDFLIQINAIVKNIPNQKVLAGFNGHLIQQDLQEIYPRSGKDRVGKINVCLTLITKLQAVLKSSVNR